MTVRKSLPMAVYAGIWIVGILIVGLFERDVFPSGFASNEGVAYFLNLAVIVLTLAGMYVALKLFQFPFVRRRIERAFRTDGPVRKLNYLRMALMAFVLYSDIIVYYATLSSQGGFCALIAALAFVFCFPSSTPPPHPNRQP